MLKDRRWMIQVSFRVMRVGGGMQPAEAQPLEGKKKEARNDVETELTG